MIEAFRENALHTLESSSEIDTVRLEALLYTAFSQLNKRLPQAQLVSVDRCVSLTLHWLMSAYDRYSHRHMSSTATVCTAAPVCTTVPMYTTFPVYTTAPVWVTVPFLSKAVIIHHKYLRSLIVFIFFYDIQPTRLTIR